MSFREILKWVLLLWLTVVIWAAFMYVPPAEKFIGESSRIVFFHVPTAWVATLAFLVSCIASVMYLRRRDPKDDIRASVSAGLGLLFAVLATVIACIGFFFAFRPSVKRGALGGVIGLGAVAIVASGVAAVRTAADLATTSAAGVRSLSSMAPGCL